jgi:superfamily I DNA/RNA helicase
MPAFDLTPEQQAIVNQPFDARLFLSGPPGAGKTTAAVARLRRMLESGVSGSSILVLTPQRTLAAPYLEMLRSPDLPSGGAADVLTVGGLAQRMDALFWPVAAEAAGFAQPDRPPVFLTLETAQYYMARVVNPLLARGYFESIAIDRNRLLSQILDNLNKAAVVGFSHTEIAARLKAAWAGPSSQLRVYDEAQEAAEAFRTYCLAHNLLDFSLQLEVFARHIWPLPLCRDYVLGRYRNLIADNIEEDTPVAHDLLLAWLPHCDSALLVFDDDGGYRRFLGADPASALRLAESCTETVTLEGSLASPPAVLSLANALGHALNRDSGLITAAPLQALDFAIHRFHPEMLDWVANRTAELVHCEGVPPREVAILAPFLDSALRFSLQSRLSRLNIPTRSHRPSRALRDEPPARALLTLAALCHPEWGICPARADIAVALSLAIGELDPARAHLLAHYGYADSVPQLTPFERLSPDLKERITYWLGERFDTLRIWIEQYATRRNGAGDDGKTGPRSAPLDHFLGRLFGELLSQRGYGFHGEFDAGAVTAELIESARKLRQVMIPDVDQPRSVDQ